MKIIWSPEKEYELRWKRGIELSEIAGIINKEQHYDVIDHPKRPNQQIYIVPYEDYTCAVPFVIDEYGTVFIKTVYPSRKYHKQYRGKQNGR